MIVKQFIHYLIMYYNIHMIIKSPPHVRATLPSSSDSSDSENASNSDSSSANLAIPDHATVSYTIVDGKPGLQVN